MNSTSTGQIITTFTDTIGSYFTDNILIVVSFTVGFMVLSLLWRVVQVSFTTSMNTQPEGNNYADQWDYIYKAGRKAGYGASDKAFNKDYSRFKKKYKNSSITQDQFEEAYFDV